MPKRKRNRTQQPTDNRKQQDAINLEEQARVNFELANELLSTVREIDGQLFDSVQNTKYINTETGNLSYPELRQFGKLEPALLIKNKRRLDFMQWGSIADSGNIYRGVKLTTAQPDYQPDKAERKRIAVFESEVVKHLFFPPNETTPNLGKFIGAAYNDFFDMDDITFEIRYSKLGRPMGLHLQDPMLFKTVVKPPRYRNYLRDHELDELIEELEKDAHVESDINDNDIDPDYMLVYQNKYIAGVDWNRVRKHHFFVQSDFKRAQRGYGIVEQGWRMLNYIMQALTSNSSNFTNNRLPPGFFAFTGGGISPVTLEKMKKIFYAYQSGANNANRFPMLSLNNEKADVKWVGVRGNSKDLEYHQYMTLLFSIFCQLSGTDPREVSLGAYGDAVAKSSLFQDSSDGIIKESRDIGAKTFLKHLEAAINSPNSEGENIFKQLTGLDLKLEFTGFEIEDKQAKNTLIREEINTTKSINNVLAESEQEKATFMLGDLNIYDIVGIGNPQVFQAVMFKTQNDIQQQQAAQQQQMQQQTGGMPPGAEGMPPEGAEQGQGGQPTPEELSSLIGGQPEQAQEGEPQQGQPEGLPQPPEGQEGQPQPQETEELTPEELKFIEEMEAKGIEIDPQLMEEMERKK